ncbi:MAG: glycosyltransferase family 61 protein [Cyanobacteria bacterium]|nr:glycosyltransferase family 61 protein [Cyanobacteriota bacterium]
MSCVLPPSHRYSSCICPLVHPSNWHSYYYHWIIDILPRVISASLFQRMTGTAVTLIVPQLSNDWILNSLHCLNADLAISLIKISRRITSLSSDLLLMAPGARIPARSTFSDNFSQRYPEGLVHPSLINELSRLITRTIQAKQVHPSPSCWPKRVYISRSDSSFRRIINEQEILDLLLPHGFTSLALSKLDFSTQVSIFNNAEIIVGAHGAGLTNVIFAKHASILEIFAFGHGVRPDFYQLANIRKCKYFAIVEPSVNPANDIMVTPSAVRAFLCQVL